MHESTEVKQAAERLRRNAYPLDSVFFEEHGCTHMEADCELLARAWLAEHTADDSEPITAEWAVINTAKTCDIKRLSYRIGMRGSSLTIAWCPQCGDLTPVLCVNHHVVCINPTRGDLRRLCSALGITLKEPRHA